MEASGHFRFCDAGWATVIPKRRPRKSPPRKWRSRKGNRSNPAAANAARAALAAATSVLNSEVVVDYNRWLSWVLEPPGARASHLFTGDNGQLHPCSLAQSPLGPRSGAIEIALNSQATCEITLVLDGRRLLARRCLVNRQATGGDLRPQHGYFQQGFFNREGIVSQAFCARDEPLLYLMQRPDGPLVWTTRPIPSLLLAWEVASPHQENPDQPRGEGSRETDGYSPTLAASAAAFAADQAGLASTVAYHSMRDAYASWGCAPVWDQIFDELSQRHYWYNRATGASQWETPPLEPLSTPTDEKEADAVAAPGHLRGEGSLATDDAIFTVAAGPWTPPVTCRILAVSARFSFGPSASD